MLPGLEVRNPRSCRCCWASRHVLWSPRVHQVPRGALAPCVHWWPHDLRHHLSGAIPPLRTVFFVKSVTLRTLLIARYLQITQSTFTAIQDDNKYARGHTICRSMAGGGQALR